MKEGRRRRWILFLRPRQKLGAWGSPTLTRQVLLCGCSMCSLLLSWSAVVFEHE